jgi:pimeloyl-ACP methyl ester carboxylesterase
MTALREGTFTANGRRVGFAEYGVRGGAPIFHFHGIPGGRFYDLDGAALRRHGAWMFTLERPGIGLSDAQPGRTLLDWPADVIAVADALGIEQFTVLGTSAGAAYALACAYAAPDRCRAVALQCALLPDVTDPTLDAHLGPLTGDATEARNDVDAYRRTLEQELAPQHDLWASDPDGFFELWVSQWPEADRARFEAEDDRWKRILGANYGGEPQIDEWVIQFTPWAGAGACTS